MKTALEGADETHIAFSPRLPSERVHYCAQKIKRIYDKVLGLHTPQHARVDKFSKRNCGHGPLWLAF
jgi:hypothetical protein